MVMRRVCEVNQSRTSPRPSPNRRNASRLKQSYPAYSPQSTYLNRSGPPRKMEVR
jgi:hypothetical protein